MISVGDTLPNLKLFNEKNELIELNSFKGKKLILFFYPKDNTPGCTKESIEFSEKLAEFESNNTVVIGVSKDSVKSHQSFCSKHNLKVMLLSDPEMKLINTCGVWQEKKNYGKTYMGIVRSTFLFNEELELIETWKNVKVNGHVDRVFSSVKS